ncbi:MAG TPA: dihydrofolate reductase family protein [Chloroflexia bacterium]|nr:dihydrofolate reductase family protein [Chloroflexia bacterium]
MATVFAGFTMSLDGFIANPDDSTEGLFDWFASGDTEYLLPGGKMTVRLSPASAMVMRDIWQRVGAVVAGRRMFDIAHGWGGSHPLNVPVFVVSHSIPEGWPRDDAPFTFVIGVADGVESAIEQAKQVAGDKLVIVAGANIAQQALKAGLVDELELDLVPVLLGRGIRAFEYLGIEPVKLERIFAVLAPDVTHLRFRVKR